MAQLTEHEIINILENNFKLLEDILNHEKLLTIQKHTTVVDNMIDLRKVINNFKDEIEIKKGEYDEN